MSATRTTERDDAAPRCRVCGTPGEAPESAEPAAPAVPAAAPTGTRCEWCGAEFPDEE